MVSWMEKILKMKVMTAGEEFLKKMLMVIVVEAQMVLVVEEVLPLFSEMSSSILFLQLENVLQKYLVTSKWFLDFLI